MHRSSIVLVISLSLFCIRCRQPKDKKLLEINCPTEGFCIQDSQLFYNGKKIELSVDINSLIPVLGNYDRVIKS